MKREDFAHVPPDHIKTCRMLLRTKTIGNECLVSGRCCDDFCPFFSGKYNCSTTMEYKISRYALLFLGLFDKPSYTITGEKYGPI